LRLILMGLHVRLGNAARAASLAHEVQAEL
jgi:hypothetical protein